MHSVHKTQSFKVQAACTYTVAICARFSYPSRPISP